MKGLYDVEEINKLIDEVSENAHELLEESYVLVESINVAAFETELLKEKLIPLEFISELLELPTYNHYSLPKKVRRKRFLEERKSKEKSE